MVPYISPYITTFEEFGLRLICGNPRVFTQVGHEVSASFTCEAISKIRDKPETSNANGLRDLAHILVEVMAGQYEELFRRAVPQSQNVSSHECLKINMLPGGPTLSTTRNAQTSVQIMGSKLSPNAGTPTPH